VPTRPPAVIASVQHATTGHGFGIDVGVGAVVDRWEVGVGANGLWNRIDWSDVDQTTYVLPTLLTGGSFLELLTTPIGTVRVELPVDYRGDLAYHADRWTAMAEVGHGFSGTSFHGGIEERVNRFAFRAGARYTLQQWNPSGGVGFDISRRVGIDVAAFGTSANIERIRKLAIATSVRINRFR